MEVALKMKHQLATRLRIRWRIRWMTASGLLATALIGGTAVQASAHARHAGGSVDPQLTRVAKSSPSKRVTVIAQFHHSVNETGCGTPSSTAHTARSPSAFPAIDGLAASLDARDAVALGVDSEVEAVTLNTSVAGQGSVSTQNLASTWDNSVNAPQVWNSGSPLTGQGVGVAVIDSGVAGNLPDFQVSQSNTTSRVVASAVVNSRRQQRRGPVRSRHNGRGHHRGQRARPALQRSAVRALRGRRSEREHHRDQGRRRPGQRQRPGRGQRHPVRDRQPGHVQHPRHQPVARVGDGPVRPGRPARRGGGCGGR